MHAGAISDAYCACFMQGPSTSLAEVQLAPGALLTLFYPPSKDDPIGLDLLNDTRRRDITLSSLEANRLTLQVRRSCASKQ